MKKWWIIPLVLILLTIAVDAKCGDSFCDPNEDCTNCADDCLCTKDKHDKQIECCNDFTCKECQEHYCHDRWCSTLEGFTSIFQKATCSDNGSVSLEIKFLELDSNILTPGEDLKVYTKQGDEETFKEINGVWTNPSRQGEFRYTKINGISNFLSDADLFKLKGDYYVRVKYQIGRSNSIFEDKTVSCPGTPQPILPEEPEEPKEEIVEEPAEKPAEEPVEPVKEEEPKEETAKEPEEKPKSNLLWYAIIGIIILGVIILFVKYELKIIRRV